MANQSNSEAVNLAKFLGCLTEKNYSEANKYLRAVVDSKVAATIRKSQQEK
jgi:hypothetical protein